MLQEFYLHLHYSLAAYVIAGRPIYEPLLVFGRKLKTKVPRCAAKLLPRLTFFARTPLVFHICLLFFLLQIFWFDCPAGTVFDETVSVCNFPWAAPACDVVEDNNDSNNGGSSGGEGDKADVDDNNSEDETFVVVAPSFNFEVRTHVNNNKGIG